MSHSLSFVLPAYNEATNIEQSIRSAQHALGGLAARGVIGQWEIVVVDDGSSDDTAVRVEQATDPSVRLISHEVNRGYGAALRTGFDATRYDLVFFTDADLQFDAFEIAKLLPFINTHDIVAGYRSPRQDPWVRRANARAWGMALYGAFGLSVQDVNCAFKLFHRRVLDDLEIASDGAFVNAEILLRAKQRGHRIQQVPVTHYARRAGSQTGAHPKVVVRAFLELARFYRLEREATEPFGPWTSEPRAASLANTIR